MNKIVSDNELFNAAIFIEQMYEIDIHKDIIFSNDLNSYFNCKFDNKDDFIQFNIEVEEGSAQFFIENYSKSDLGYEISCNDIAWKYIDRASE